MDKIPSGPPLPQLPSSRPAVSPQFPPLPPLDRSAPPQQSAQPVLTGTQRLDSLEAKLAVQKSMVDSVIPVRMSTPLPCSVAPCLNYTSVAYVSFDLTFMQYRFSPMCPECIKRPRP